MCSLIIIFVWVFLPLQNKNAAVELYIPLALVPL